MDIKINADYLNKKNDLIESILKYDSVGDILFDGSRNQIKIAKLKNYTIAIKSFKIPNTFNKVIYKYFRKSKAQRSYEYAKFLSQHNIGTAEPIAYSMNFNSIGLQDSYYISEFLHVDLVLRELIADENYPEREIILKQFTQFTFKLHELGIEFLDHTPGNTLIKKISPGKYNFFLVDLNRMRFHKELSLTERLKNFKKLTQNKEIIKIISAEYANLLGLKEQFVYEKIVSYSYKLNQKKKIKHKVKHLLYL